MAVGIHNLKAVMDVSSPLVLTTVGSSTIATIYEVHNLENHVPLMARAAAAGTWITVPPRAKITIPIPAAADTDLHLATTGQPNRRFSSFGGDITVEAPTRVKVSILEIAATS